MDIAHIGHVAVSGVRATTVSSTEIPAGMIGGYITFEFDPSWDGFTRHVTIEGSGVKTTLGVSDRVSVDKALIEYPNVRVKVGVTGVSADGSRVIPTMWAELGTTRPGAPTDLSGGTPDTGQESPILAQIIAMIGDLRGLKTEAKENLVAAINELALSPEELQKIIEDALTKAKESGEFDGKDGQDGYTPQKGIDYFDGKDGQPGKDGVDGKDGAPGKSAYQYAQDGGYTGTEEEFAQKLAAEDVVCLPMPPTAAVGQFIVVSAVDESGKVTATEAVDAPAGEVLTDAEEVAF